MPDLSLAGIEAAWERVFENHGGAGVDGVTVDRFAGEATTALPELLHDAATGFYRPLPLRLIVVEKKSADTSRHPANSEGGRRLLVPCVRDRVLQTAVAHRLARGFEEEFLETSFAYRRGRGVDTAVARILQLRDGGWKHAARADIESFFDRISHALLEKRLEQEDSVSAECRTLLKQWIRAEVWDGRRVEPLKRGVAQGSPISPLLANVFLDPLDRALAEEENKLIRYADDLLILCRSREAAEKAMAGTQKILTTLGLDLNMAKSRIASFEEGFTFLGVRFGEGEALIPWKMSHGAGRVMFMAHTMPPTKLRVYRKEAAARALPATNPRVSATGERQATLSAEEATAKENDVPFLYVTEQGAIVRKSGERFLVESDGGIIFDIPCHRLENILVFGNIQITSQAMAEALDHNIALSLFTRQGRFRGALTPPPGHNVLLRMAQYGARQDPERALSLARETVRWKIENEIRVLEKYADRGGEATGVSPEGARQACAELAELQGGLDEAQTVPEVEGREGAAAKNYYTAVMAYNRSDMEWPGREKHPAKDPLNALLSLCYTMLMHELTAIATASGLDPAIGFLHDVDGARPSLALDLMEPFRAPVADRLALTLINRGQIGKKDFEKRDDHGGLFLKPDAMRTFFEAYERWMLAPVERGSEKPGTFRRMLGREVDKMATYLRQMEQPGAGETVWAPWGFEEADSRHGEESRGAVAG